MAITDIVVSGKVYQDDGDPVVGATVQLLETGTTTVEATYDSANGTGSAGQWSFTETSLDTTYDVKITSGTSIRKILWSDEITTKGVDTASLKVRGVEGAAAPIYFFADQADDAGDGWRMQASASDTFAIGSNKASATAIVDYLTITNGANAAASTVTVGGILTVTTTLDINGTADFDVADFDIASSGDIDLVSTNDAAAAIYLHQSTGTSGTIKIHADTGTSVTEGQASIQLLSDVGGINIKSGLNGANAILLTADGGTSETIVIHADQGTGASSIKLVSDDGGIQLDSGLDITISADGGNITMDDGTTVIFDFDVDNTTLTIHDDQDTGDKAVFTMAQHGALSIVTTDDDAAAADFTIDADGEIVIDAADAAGAIFKIAGTAQLSVIEGAILPTTDNDIDLGSGSYQFKDAYINGTANLDAVDIDGNVQLDGTFTAGATTDGYDVKFWGNTSDTYMLWDENTDDLVLTLGAELYFYDAAGGEHIKSDGTDMTIYAGTDLNLTVGMDINIPASVGLTFGDDGEKIEGDGANLVVASSGTLDMNSGGLLTLDSGAAINIEPASGSVILLDGTISVDAGVVTGATSLTIGDTVITDGVITDSSGLRFTADVHFGDTNTDQDVNFYGVNTNRDMSWDAANNALWLQDNAGLWLGAGTDLQLYHASNVSYITGANYPLQISLNDGNLSNVGASGNDLSATGMDWGLSSSGIADVIDLHNTSIASGSGVSLTLRLNDADGNQAGSRIKLDKTDNTGGSMDTRLLFDLVVNGGNNEAMRLLGTGVLSVDLAGTGSAAQVDLFDDYDDPVELQRYAYMQSDRFGTIDDRAASFEKMLDMGVISAVPGASSGYHMNLQPMVRLLAGGIYQNRERIDGQYEQLNERLARIEQVLGA